MPTKIVVAGADEADEVEHWVEDEVVRLGADPRSDIRLPGRHVAPHTATLEYNDGSYLVYNRSPAAFQVGGRVVPPGGSAPWHGGHRLETGDGTALTLRIEGDPAPARRPVAGEPDDGEADDFDPAAVAAPHAAAAPAASVQAKLQGAVALACGLAAAALAVSILAPDLDPFAALTAEPSRAPTFAAVIRELCRAEADGDGDRDLAAIRDALQSARIATTRGDLAAAATLLDRVRDVLIARGRLADCADPIKPAADAAAATDPPQALDCRVWAYVRAHR